MGLGFLKAFVFSFLVLFIAGCDFLTANQSLPNYTYNVTSYGPVQGYAGNPQTIQVSGTNLTASDVLQVGGVTCVSNTSLVTTNTYTCTLPAFCATLGSCSYAQGQQLAVTYNQGGQVLTLSPAFTIEGFAAPSMANMGITYLGVHAYASESLDLSERILGQDGGQIVVFQFSQTLTNALYQITIGDLSVAGKPQVPCNAIQPDPKGGLFYQCKTAPYNPTFGSPVSLSLQPINFYFANYIDTNTGNNYITVPNAFFFTEAGPMCSNGSVSGSALAVAEDCASQTVMGDPFFMSTTINPVHY